MAYEIMNMTYSPIRLIMTDFSEITIGSRVSDENFVLVPELTEQIKQLAEKNFVKVRTLSN